MLFSGYICKERFEKCRRNFSVYIKKLLIRALTKSPGVSTSGLSYLCYTRYLSDTPVFYDFPVLVIATLTHTADQHIHLFAHITTRQLDARYRHAFQTNRVATGIANEVNMVIVMLSSRTVLIT